MTIFDPQKSDLVIVSGNEELARLCLDLFVLFQSDDCCHCGKHWDICNRQTDRPLHTRSWAQNHHRKAVILIPNIIQNVRLTLSPVVFPAKKRFASKGEFCRNCRERTFAYGKLNREMLSPLNISHSVILIQGEYILQ